MSMDFDRLAQAVREARNARGWRQQDLADKAGVGLSSVQNIEAARRFNRIPTSLRKIDAALGWALGSSVAVLSGGEPTPRRQASDTASDTPADALASAGASASPELPVPIRLMLEDGEVVDYDLITLPGDDSPVAFIGLAHPGKYDTEDSRADLRRRLQEFRRIVEKVRREVDDPSTQPDAQE